MAIQRGKDVLIQIKNEDTSQYLIMAGMRVNSFSLNNQIVDVTNSSSPNYWRELLADVGLRSMSLSGSGVFSDDASQKYLIEQFINQNIISAKLVIPNLYEITGQFLISNLDYIGDYDKEASMSLALESASELVFTPSI